MRTVCRIEFIEDVLDRDHQIVVQIIPCGIHIFGDGDEADVMLGEILAQIVSDFDVITPETGQVFDDDRVDIPSLHFFHHAEKIRAFEVRACPSVITEKGIVGNPEIAAVIAKDFLLRFDGYACAVLLIVVTQTAVAGGDNSFALH